MLCLCRTHWQGLDHPSPYQSPMFLLTFEFCTLIQKGERGREGERGGERGREGGEGGREGEGE